MCGSSCLMVTGVTSDRRSISWCMHGVRPSTVGTGQEIPTTLLVFLLLALASCVPPFLTFRFRCYRPPGPPIVVYVTVIHTLLTNLAPTRVFRARDACGRSCIDLRSKFKGVVPDVMVMPASWDERSFPRTYARVVRSPPDQN